MSSSREPFELRLGLWGGARSEVFVVAARVLGAGLKPVGGYRALCCHVFGSTNHVSMRHTGSCEPEVTFMTWSLDESGRSHLAARPRPASASAGGRAFFLLLLR